MLTFAADTIQGWHNLNVLEIVRHPWFVSAFLAGGLSQVIKLTTSMVKTRRLKLSRMAEPGGMPSAHSALVTALALSVGFTDGFHEPAAMIAVGLATITMADAISIRRAAGEHAKLLNRIVDRLNETERFEANRLRERLGHSRREVIAGIVFGALIALCVCGFWDFWK